jgi:Tfp pilus assembly PilM family ATPase
MQLYETTIEDVKYDYDVVTPSPHKGSQGVRVVLSYGPMA